MGGETGGRSAELTGLVIRLSGCVSKTKATYVMKRIVDLPGSPDASGGWCWAGEWAYLASEWVPPRGVITLVTRRPRCRGFRVERGHVQSVSKPM